MASRLLRCLLVILLGCAVGAVTACRRGPGADALGVELQQRLDRNFEEGLFRVESLRRRGSSPLAGTGGGGGALVYYDAEIVFERDYSLTAWKGLNLGTLAFVLGANEAGVQGFAAKGNRAGDALQVHGRLAYQREEGAWSPAARGTPPSADPPALPVDLRGSGPEAVLGQVKGLLDRSPETARGGRDAVIVEELRRAAARIELAIARLDGDLTFGAGPAGGAYHAFGRALGESSGAGARPLYSYASEGSRENGRRLRDRSLDFALMQSDVAELLYQGWREEGVFPDRDLRSVASLWPEAVYLVTLEGSGIRELRDLARRRIGIGPPGSGTRFNAVAIGVAAGVRAEEVSTVFEIGIAEGLAGLEDGSVDALFTTGAVPTPALQEFAARRPDLRFVSIEPAVVDRLSEEHFAYYPLTVEARTYPGQEEPFRTLGVASTLMTTRHAADEDVEGLLTLLVDRGDDLARRYFRAGFVGPETMRLGMAVPLHPAAERFYARRDEPPPPETGSETGAGSEPDPEPDASGGRREG